MQQLERLVDLVELCRRSKGAQEARARVSRDDGSCCDAQARQLRSTRGTFMLCVT